MEIKNITVLGGGVLGSQIAFQSAYCGMNVTIWSRDEKDKEEVLKKLNKLEETYIETINQMHKKETWAMGIASPDNFNKKECLEKAKKVVESIKIETNLQEAVKDKELVIESIIENLEIKNQLYTKLSPYLNEKTIVVTNSSTLLPSKMAKYTKRENKFLSLHFANSIWKNNIAEVMKQSKTSEDSFKKVINFAENINMLPLPVHKEKSGYLLNSMLIPLLFSAMDLYVNNISDPKSIDTAWTKGTGAPNGPFEIIDTIGLNTAYNVVLMYVKIPSFLAPYNFKAMEKVLKKLIDEGKLGKQTKEGFYKWD